MPSGGFGGSGLGPLFFGTGGPISVVRALAVAGQVVRVVFDDEPLHRSPAGGSDALNPSNYSLTVTGGAAVAPTPVGVDRDPIVGPARGVGNGTAAADERGMDVHVDRPLVVGVGYQVFVRNVQSMSGGTLASPYSAIFGGVTRLEETKVPARNQDLIDLANPAFVGGYVFDDSGDLATDTPEDGLRKRIYRRLTTRRGSFRWMPGYGSTIDLKETGSLAKISAAQADLTAQVKQEPDVAAASVRITVFDNGVTIIRTAAKSRKGAFVDVGARVTPLGEISPA